METQMSTIQMVFELLKAGIPTALTAYLAYLISGLLKVFFIGYVVITVCKIGFEHNHDKTKFDYLAQELRDIVRKR